MQSPQPLLDIGAARATACKHVGEDMNVIACWQPPEPLYRIVVDGDKDGDDNTFYFAVVEKRPKRVGDTRHIAVDRRTGAVTELGIMGE